MTVASIFMHLLKLEGILPIHCSLKVTQADIVQTQAFGVVLMACVTCNIPAIASVLSGFAYLGQKIVSGAAQNLSANITSAGLSATVKSKLFKWVFKMLCK